MKNYFILPLTLAASIATAQVGIGSNPTSITSSDALKLSSPNKGILIPNVPLQNATAPATGLAPIGNTTQPLLVYNSNPQTIKGFYLWKNGWSPLLNSNNVTAFLGLINSSTVVSTGSVIDNTQDGQNQYNTNESPSVHQWAQIPGVSQTITINAPTNNVSINVNGVMQVTLPNSNTYSNSFAVAIFVDNQLKIVRNFLLSASNCTYTDFNIMGVLENLSVGTHTIRVYETYRANVTQTNVNASLHFGQKANACTNLTNDMSRTTMNIQITENP